MQEFSVPAEEAGAVLTIDLAALADNWRLLRDRAQGAECAAVVKADAYGIGIEPAVRALAQAGCRTFFVAHPGEGKRVRAVAPDAVVHVLNGLPPGAEDVFAAHDLRPVLGSREEIQDWARFCRRIGRALPAALHVDTGMNRLGMSLADAAAIKESVDLLAFEPSLVMTHLVSAEAPDDSINARQLAAFGAVRRLFPKLPASFANSSGIFLPGKVAFDLVRPGYALYGGNPTPGHPNPMSPVVRLEARIIQTRAIAAGEGAGYGWRWTAPGKRLLATLSIGYADGYPRAASGTGDKYSGGEAAGMAVVGGVRCPFVGTVSMDLIIIDVTDAPPAAATRGEMATLIGDGLGIDEVGSRAGTIGYEILTGLGRRYARHYIGG